MADLVIVVLSLAIFGLISMLSITLIFEIYEDQINEWIDWIISHKKK